MLNCNTYDVGLPTHAPIHTLTHTPIASPTKTHPASGFTAGGEVLNCSTYDAGLPTHARHSHHTYRLHHNINSPRSGFTAGGEVLNCNTYDVGLHAAVELGADKLFCMHLDDVVQVGDPRV